MIKKCSSILSLVLMSAVLVSCVARSGQPPHSGNSVTSETVGTVNKREITDIQFTPNLTHAQVTAIWGQMDGPRGSGVQYFGYSLEGGQEVWLSFLPDPPYRLNMALLVPQKGKAETLFPR